MSDQLPEIQIPSDGADVHIRGKEQAFLVFASLACDVVRTAHALNIREKDVERMAEEGKWRERLSAIVQLKNSSDPATVERGISRAINFCQAHRFRLVMERVINRLTDLTPAELEKYLLTETFDIKSGQVKYAISGRGLADAATALEKCHALTYLALSDTAQDRNRREEQGESKEASGDLHRLISKAMAEIADVKTPGDLLTDAQLASAAVSVAKVKVTVTEPTAPYDKGD